MTYIVENLLTDNSQELGEKQEKTWTQRVPNHYQVTQNTRLCHWISPRKKSTRWKWRHTRHMSKAHLKFNSIKHTYLISKSIYVSITLPFGKHKWIFQISNYASSYISHMFVATILKTTNVSSCWIKSPSSSITLSKRLSYCSYKRISSFNIPSRISCD